MDVRYDRDSLVPVTSLPYPFQPIFKFRYFNAVQSESFGEAYLSDHNMVVSAPTGSGKTGLFELCILRLLSRDVRSDGHFVHVRGSQKIVYIGPMKALVQEIFREWKNKFGQVLGLDCQELTGDTHAFRANEIRDTDIILTTPEKFDSITRYQRDHGSLEFFGDIALLLLDEVHLLNDSRGAALEAIVSRIKMLGQTLELKGSPIATIRFVAVSATLPNIEDLAEWLKVPKRGIKRFGEEMRPVKLTTKVYGFPAAKNDFLFEKKLQNFLYDIVVRHSAGKPALVFCCSRKGAQDAALVLADTVNRPGARNPFIKSQQQFDRLVAAASGVADKSMQTCIARGAYHNGGLNAADRALVEGLFLRSDLQVLCTTSTLAQGVNLPAHLVVIKSTQFFNKEKGRYVEHDRSTLFQMSGRAGRPQFDDTGVVVLMTRNETVHLYENILSGTEPVESELLPSIAEHLNAEIVLMTVSDVGRAIEWLKCSYLYVRMRKHPKRYNIDNGITKEQMEKHMKGICLKAVNELAKYGLTLMDEYGFTLKPLEPGCLMAKYCLNFETMKTITEVPARSDMDELLRALSKARELSWIQLRRHEKKVLNAINHDNSGRIRFHVLGPNGKAKKRIQTDDEKVFVLVNHALSDEPSTLDFSMSQDMTGIFSNGSRIARCMGEYFKVMRRYTETKNSILLSKCLRQRLWDNSAHQLKQLPGIGPVTVKAFQAAGIDSFEKLGSADPRYLESVAGRRFPYGDQVKDSLTALPPKVDLKVRHSGFQIAVGNEYSVELTRATQPKTSNRWHMADLVVGDECGTHMLYHERISPYIVSVSCTSGISAALLYEEYVGMDTLEKISGCGKPKGVIGSTGRQLDQKRETRRQPSRKRSSTALESAPSVVLGSLQKESPIFPVSSQQKSTKEFDQQPEKKSQLPQLLVDHNVQQGNYCTLSQDSGVPPMHSSSPTKATAAEIPRNETVKCLPEFEAVLKMQEVDNYKGMNIGTSATGELNMNNQPSPEQMPRQLTFTRELYPEPVNFSSGEVGRPIRFINPRLPFSDHEPLNVLSDPQSALNKRAVSTNVKATQHPSNGKPVTGVPQFEGEGRQQLWLPSAVGGRPPPPASAGVRTAVPPSTPYKTEEVENKSRSVSRTYIQNDETHPLVRRCAFALQNYGSCDSSTEQTGGRIGEGSGSLATSDDASAELSTDGTGLPWRTTTPAPGLPQKFSLFDCGSADKGEHYHRCDSAGVVKKTNSLVNAFSSQNVTNPAPRCHRSSSCPNRGSTTSANEGECSSENNARGAHSRTPLAISSYMQPAKENTSNSKVRPDPWEGRSIFSFLFD